VGTSSIISPYFEKAKNQNVLRDSDVSRIVETYRTRSEAARFSHRAHLAEIERNNFNLNIPRYVDTFEAEGEIDLKAVASELRRIDHDMTAIDADIRGFCIELGLETPL
jgi:type I restriction enzyme M protein